jgi:hypothetical protein
MIAGVAVFIVGSCLSAQDLPYTSGSTGADGPLSIPLPLSARSRHAAAFHAGQGSILVFGGSSGPSSRDTIIRTTPSWTSINPGASPSAQINHGMVYDAARQEVILFGGIDSNGTTIGDTWAWDGTTWSAKSPAVSPSARSEHAMVYDSVNQKVILFGGLSSGGIAQGDMWEWNGNTWSQLNPANRPSARSGHAMSYDSVRQRVVLFGGLKISGLTNETWEWDGINWEEKILTPKPTSRISHAMVFDPVRQETLLFGNQNPDVESETWTYSATGWTLKAVVTNPPIRYDHTLTYDPQLQKVVMVGGFMRSISNQSASTWLWDGTNWAIESDSTYPFDMAAKPSGVWNFTTIDIPAGVTVNFLRNLTNTPVQWLASGNVNISGSLNLNGENGRASTNVESGNEALGGPGGFNGGLGGRIFSISSSFVGTSGGGPGGGAAGAGSGLAGGNGTYSGVYGNAFIQPIIGGSGGGGSGSTASSNGGNGGAGGGAILIASSRDLQVSGAIRANGGSGSGIVSAGGSGSGGAIRLIADRVLGSGILSASGNGVNGNGRIRVEGYFRPLTAANVSPSPSASAPTETFVGLGTGMALTIASVDGAGVRQPPLANTADPDVIFTKAGVVTITVAGTNIANGTPVTLRLTTSSGTQILPAPGAPAIRMNANTAIFTATVPAGVGTIQAYATVTP